MNVDVPKSFADVFLNVMLTLLKVPLIFLTISSMLIIAPSTFLHAPSTTLLINSQTSNDVPLLSKASKIT